jgi:hypothetical protein
MMMVMAATALQILQGLLGSTQITTLKRLAQLGERAIALNVAITTQASECLLSGSQITGFQGGSQVLHSLLALLPVTSGCALSGTAGI